VTTNDDRRTDDLGTAQDDLNRDPLRAGPVDERHDERHDDDRVDDVVDEGAEDHDRTDEGPVDRADDRVDDLVGDERRDDRTGTEVDAPAADTAADTAAGKTATETTVDDEAPLVPHETAVDYTTRWEAIQQGFVDDPRSAVTDADALVGDVLQNLAATFETQHKELEGQWSEGEPSTEDLRSALRRYRDFFERLLRL
jgi:hypothetical protein